ncbi:MAG: phage scaffolding protein [Lachnospiraceae bacterium]|nr:phage scaffolding protein [Lachnospiraceae bacterium]
MKREDLAAKGLTPEQVEFVMAEYGKEYNPLVAERDSYKSQLTTAQTSLKAMEGVDINALNGKITELTNQLAGKDTEIQQVRADAQFSELLKDAIRTAGARSDKAVMPFLDIDSLKKSKNQTEDIKTAIESIKKENDYLFQGAKVPTFVTSTPGINQDVEDKNTQANAALRSVLGRE